MPTASAEETFTYSHQRPEKPAINDLNIKITDNRLDENSHSRGHCSYFIFFSSFSNGHFRSAVIFSGANDPYSGACPRPKGGTVDEMNALSFMWFVFRVIRVFRGLFSEELMTAHERARKGTKRGNLKFLTTDNPDGHG